MLRSSISPTSGDSASTIRTTTIRCRSRTTTIFRLRNTSRERTGTFKLSPFYRYTTNQLVTVSLGGSFASGYQRRHAADQGRRARHSKRRSVAERFLRPAQLHVHERVWIKYSTLANGTNAIDIINNYITAFNGLTKAGGGSPYYCAPGPHGVGTGPGGTNSPAASPGGHVARARNGHCEPVLRITPKAVPWIATAGTRAIRQQPAAVRHRTR